MEKEEKKPSIRDLLDEYPYTRNEEEVFPYRKNIVHIEKKYYEDKLNEGKIKKYLPPHPPELVVKEKEYYGTIQEPTLTRPDYHEYSYIYCRTLGLNRGWRSVPIGFATGFVVGGWTGWRDGYRSSVVLKRSIRGGILLAAAFFSFSSFVGYAGCRVMDPWEVDDYPSK